jgi:pimeloyl-ACP methyl ester carboxylesterase
MLGTDRTVCRDAVPEWYRAALDCPGRRAVVVSDGAEICYRTWGDGPQTPVLLVHGSGANSAWWDHIAPHLAQGRRVVALDLSGHGDSSRRRGYGYQQWAHEVRAVVGHADLAARPAIVGHSFGGAVALHAHELFAGFFAAVITIDSPLRALSAPDWARKVARATQPLRVYESRAEAVRAFRTVPGQPVAEYLRAHVAGESVTPVHGGWRWKFDPAVFERPQFDAGSLAPSPSAVALVRAEFGSMSAETSRTVAHTLGPQARELTILNAHHHVMFDQPVALIAVLQTLIGAIS